MAKLIIEYISEELSSNTYVTLLGSKCRSKENKRQKNSSNHSEKRIIGMTDTSSSNEDICEHKQVGKTISE